MRFGEEIVRPLPVIAVALREHSEPDRPRVDAGVDKRGHEYEVAEGLAHLLAAVGHEPSVRVQVRERAPGKRSRMTRAELVVREHEVGTTAVHRERHVEELLRDDRALDVPARPACAEHGLPARVTVAGAAPKQRGGGAALTWSGGMTPSFSMSRRNSSVCWAARVRQSTPVAAARSRRGSSTSVVFCT